MSSECLFCVGDLSYISLEIIKYHSCLYFSVVMVGTPVMILIKILMELMNNVAGAGREGI